MINVESVSQDETIVNEAGLICCLKDDDNIRNVFIFKDDGVHLYDIIRKKITIRKTTNLNGTVAVTQCGLGASSSKFLVVLKRDCELLMLDVSNFEIAQKLRLELAHYSEVRRALMFFDDAHQNLNICVDGHSMFCVEASKLLSGNLSVPCLQFYHSNAEIVGAVCVCTHRRNYLLLKKDVITGSLTLEVLSPFVMDPQMPGVNKHCTSSATRMIELIAQKNGREKIRGFFPLSSRHLVVVVTSQRVFLAGDTLEAFENTEMNGRPEFKNLHALHKDSSLILSIQNFSGNVYTSKIDTRRAASPIKWSLLRVDHPREMTGYKFVCRALSSTEYAFISDTGFWVYDSTSKKTSFLLSCEQKTYVDAIVAERSANGLPLRVIACGGNSPYSGFVECFRMALHADTLRILKVNPSFENNGLTDFWLTDNGIVASTLLLDEENELCYVSKSGTKLRQANVCCATQLGNDTSDLLYLDVAGQLYFAKEAAKIAICFIAQLSNHGTWSISASHKTDADGLPSFIVLSKGNIISVLSSGLLQASFQVDCFNIDEIFVDRLFENTLTIVVSCDTGVLLLISYLHREKTFLVTKTINFDEGVPLQLCDIKNHGDTIPLVFVYNRHKVWILNLANANFNECILNYGIKRMRFLGSDRYIVLTTNDLFVTLRFKPTMQPVWTRGQALATNSVPTHIIGLENPRFVAVASQNDKNFCKMALLDTAALQILDEYTFPERGIVRGLLKLQKPYDHKILVSFMGKSAIHDSLLVLSVKNNKFVCVAEKMIEGTSSALTQRDAMIIHAGRNIEVLKLQKRGGRWNLCAIEKPIHGSGPLSLVCSAYNDEQMTVLCATKGVRVYELKSAICIASSAPSFHADNHDFATLFEDTSFNEERDVELLLDPVKQAETELYLIKVHGRNLTASVITPADSGKVQFKFLCSKSLPFNKTVTRIKQAGSKESLVCARGGLYIIKIR
ncbi:uncharacterized protein LALA0_S07e00958g [Lachancea lanzarotensis]|uniref:LALA0S07e00958g1_1 n=1 Tax=Lachancea lanzarotensis TaxID=1245769 RepID=A0A0C7N968_9SACH|nr:uncharacterized protein LALA0_S07e00958g [Lachancea lanzarotensis]CEP63035.1 LALA0S07e00958g1_1 [Lachancea lanzarotensis]